MEDYLEDGLDFSGRFGMERHADQCIGCGKDLAGAQKLRAMVHEIGKVKAPYNFESSVLRRIEQSKSQSRLANIRRNWIYGFEWPSMQKLAVASSALIVLGFGIFLVNNKTAINKPSVAPAVVAHEIPIVNRKSDLVENTLSAVPQKKKQATAEVARIPEVPEIPESTEDAQLSVFPESEQFDDPELAEADYMEYQVVGPDNRPLKMRMPMRRSRIQRSQSPEDYFLRNVSH
jgi:hypothetical protein